MKKNKFRLSIIIPTFNNQDTIISAIRSISDQQVDFKFKIIVADDYSKDSTLEKVKEITAGMDNVTLLERKRNLGVPFNHHDALLNYVDTEYFAFLDADDYYTDISKLQKQIEVLDENLDCSICSHKTLRKFPDRNEIFPMHKEGKYSRPIEVHTSSKIIRSNVISRIKNTTPLLVDDTAMNYVSITCGNNYFLDEVMSVYVDNGAGIWTGKSDEFQKKLAILGKSIIYKYNYGCFIPYSETDMTLLKNQKGIDDILRKYSAR